MQNFLTGIRYFEQLQQPVVIPRDCPASPSNFSVRVTIYIHVVYCIVVLRSRLFPSLDLLFFVIILIYTIELLRIPIPSLTLRTILPEIVLLIFSKFRTLVPIIVRRAGLSISCGDRTSRITLLASHHISESLPADTSKVPLTPAIRSCRSNRLSS